MSNIMATAEPKGGAALVAEAVKRHQKNSGGVGSSVLGQAEIGLHHRVYDLSVEALANGQGVDAAVAVGSRFLIRTSAGLIAAAEVGTDASGTQATEFRSLNFGPMVTGTEKVIHMAESDQGDEGCEIALLRVGALKLWAIRVVPKHANGNERIYVLEPAPSGMKAGRAYSSAEFAAAAIPIARDLLAAASHQGGAADD